MYSVILSCLSFLRFSYLPGELLCQRHKQEREYMGQKETRFATLLSYSQWRFIYRCFLDTSYCTGQENMNKSVDSSSGKFGGFKKRFPGKFCLFCVSGYAQGSTCCKYCRGFSAAKMKPKFEISRLYVCTLAFSP